jgi:small-conductance mechanosensitive channel
MQDLAGLIVDFLSSDRAGVLLESLIKLVGGFVLARLVSRGVGRLMEKQLETHQLMLVERVSFYTIFGLFGASAIMALGFDLSIILGAGGILMVAFGFASQTSASNVISGLFLLGEKPFAIGDIIRVGQTTGEVLSIDLLSVKLRTFDNLFVRIPNETMIKSEITNLRRFPIRRYDLQVGVAYKEDIPTVQEVLFEVADENPLCLEEPKPLIIFQGFGESSLNFQFSVWAQTENFLPLRNSIPAEVKQAFDEAGIEIPFPHRTLYTGSVTEPFPVRMVDGQPSVENSDPEVSE